MGESISQSQEITWSDGFRVRLKNTAPSRSRPCLNHSANFAWSWRLKYIARPSSPSTAVGPCAKSRRSEEDDGTLSPSSPLSSPSTHPPMISANLRRHLFIPSPLLDEKSSRGPVILCNKRCCVVVLELSRFWSAIFISRELFPEAVATFWPPPLRREGLRTRVHPWRRPNGWHRIDRRRRCSQRRRKMAGRFQGVEACEVGPTGWWGQRHDEWRRKTVYGHNAEEWRNWSSHHEVAAMSPGQWRRSRLRHWTTNESARRSMGDNAVCIRGFWWMNGRRFRLGIA